MQRELDLEVVGTGVPDTSNLMRLIQGTVMPQVRAICTYIECLLLSIDNLSIIFYNYILFTSMSS